MWKKGGAANFVFGVNLVGCISRVNFREIFWKSLLSSFACRMTSQDTKLPRVYLDIKIGDDPVGELVIVLRQDVVGKTCENFRALCTGEKGFSKDTGEKLCFKGTTFHTVIPNVVAQGGDISGDDGTGGESIYGEAFEDECFTLRHTGRGVLSMANSGPDSNRSQFYISFGENDWLDDAHVVFGYVVKGLDVLEKIENVGTRCGKPQQRILIMDCGQLKGYG